MFYSNISLGKNVFIDPSSSFNNAKIGDNVLIGNKVTIFGSPKSILEIGDDTTIGNMTILNGFASKLTIGKRCSIGSFCHFFVDSGPTASQKLLKKYPIIAAPVTIGDDCFIGHGTTIVPGAVIGDCCIIMPNSFINCEVPSYSIYGGSPAKFIRSIEKELNN